MLEDQSKVSYVGTFKCSYCPFTEDGWFQTGDAVETDGEYLKIIGRKSEIINVGEKKSIAK